MLQGVRDVHITYCGGGEQGVRRKVHAVGLEPHLVVAQSYTRSAGASKPTRLGLHIKLAAALAALVRLFTHGIINGHSQQFTAVRTLHFRGTCDCSREAKFVVDEVVVKTAEFIDVS